jgi:hypothetical protein
MERGSGELAFDANQKCLGVYFRADEVRQRADGSTRLSFDSRTPSIGACD